MSVPLRSRSELLAADLAGAEVDPNEVEKALAFFRSVSEPKRFFDYLRTVVNNGEAVIRSRRTLGYYRDLLAACERHLRGLDAPTARYTLGWAIRLLRYYKAVPQSERPSFGRIGGVRESEPARNVEERTAPPVEQAPAPSKPVGPAIPEVGSVFTATISALDASAAVIAVPGCTAEQAIALLSADVADLRKYRLGNPARVEVIALKTQRSGRVLVIVKPGPKAQKG